MSGGFYLKHSLGGIILRCVFIIAGVMGAAFGCALFLLAELGSDPVTAFVQGLGKTLHVSPGMATNLLNITAFIALVIFNRKLIHIGTFLYTVLLGIMVDVFSVLIVAVLGTAPVLVVRIFMLGTGTLAIAIGLGLYQSAELGAGPTDGINQTIVAKTGLAYKWERIIFDVIMVISGWLLGGKVWFGTIVGAVCVGPIMAFTLGWSKKNIMQRLTKA
jgi:uncharacterized membrane protein YczE